MAYAADVVILVSGKSLSTLTELMESALDVLSSWTADCGLGINSKKIDLVFSRITTGLKPLG